MVTINDSAWPPAVFVLIPAYKSADTLRLFLPEIIEAVPNTHICVVDDGSFDGTDVLCSGREVQYRTHFKNRGKGAALATGFKFLLDQGAQAIITLDADGQHAPEDPQQKKSKEQPAQIRKGGMIFREKSDLGLKD